MKHSFEMTPYLALVFFLVYSFTTLFSPTSAKNVTLTNSSPTPNWGVWGGWEYCPPGSYAAGMQLKVQGRQWRGDDTALNGIKLLCAPSFMGDVGYTKKIMSKEGSFGEWGKEFKCENGYVVGFQLRSEPDQGKGYDSTAANNLRIFCSNPKIPMIEGDGMSWGSWGLEEKCLKQQAICAMQTQISSNFLSGYDEVGLNNVAMKCCDLDDPLASCEPEDNWEKVIECDNILGTAPLPCTLNKAQGLNFIKPGGSDADAAAAAAGKSKGDFGATLKSLGFSLDKAGAVFPARFSAKLRTSEKTGHDWTNEPVETWVEEVTKETHFNAPAGKLVRVFQVVGSCGPYSVRTGQFKKEEADDPF